MLFGGIVSILLGIMIWRGWPESSVLVVGILVGIKLIFAGWAMVGIGAAARGSASDIEDAVEPARRGSHPNNIECVRLCPCRLALF